MSLIDKIEDLQKKPEQVRRKILFISMTVIIFVIIAVWISVFRISLESSEQNQAEYAPFEIFKNFASEGFGASVAGIKEAVGELGKIISNGNK